ncbi:substrate-binding domain-containing protein [Alkaliphilus sp. MSJ-5]|uniref:Substrate-binding domain-containing protein n=1 Tax=Alkaliphilus flagellatus TaxID=2841507 RepID=A0ABS6G329_9FIRM|nr:substrate-binding domain-containing protein [Alkaliphilus flagellatus]MBU5676769.1 substrate-binding domain-containing protein [Alkaliphilus flagellatus]
MKKSFRKLSVIGLLLLSIFMVSCSSPKTTDAPKPDDNTPPVVAKSEIILSTTTSTENSGLLDYILPKFTEDTGYDVKVVAVGTGQALKMGEDGDADVLLVHAKSSEEEFVKAGHGIERFDVMYNDFILLGPNEDTLNLAEQANKDIVKAFSLINDGKQTFVSRGDDSGTHKMELNLWKEANVEPQGDWYVEAGQGMGAVLQMTNELNGYTLTDRATYLSMMDKLDLKVVVEGDTKLFNQYGVIAVNPEKNDKINHDGALAFVEWMLSDNGQQLISEFGKDTFGQSLFIPNAK